MKKIRILIFTVLTLTVLLVGASLSVSAETVGGNCGAENSDDVTWSFDTSTLTLTISGSGEMQTSPWRSSYEDLIVKVVIEDGVTSIGDDVFYNCSSLMSIEIPDSVTGIGDDAFYDCSSLTSIEIPDSVTSIGDGAFYYCTSLTSIEIPDSVTSIGDSAFTYCYSLTSIEIPDGVTSIGNYAFYGCTSLTSVEIPDSATSIGDWTFSGCSSLTSIVIPDGVTSIGDYAFISCSSLASIEIPDSVTSIGDDAFSSCYRLTSVVLPNSIKIVGTWFQHCENLETVYIPADLIMIKGNAFANTSLKTIIYCGTEEQWNNITKVTNWDANTPDYTVTYHVLSYSSEGENTHGITCEYCDHFLSVDHVWNNGKITTAPTHTSDGVTTYTCVDCGETKTEAIDKSSAHEYGTWCYHDDDQHKKICVCGSEVYLPHNWNKGIVTKKPSHTRKGEKTYTCLDCGAETKQTVPIVTEHEYTKCELYEGTQHKHICAYCDAFIIEEGQIIKIKASNKQSHTIFYECGVKRYQKHYSTDGDSYCDACQYEISTTSSTENSTNTNSNFSSTVTGAETKKGCRTTISASSGLILLASLGSVVLLRKKKKE